MTEHQHATPMTCASADELAGAWAFGALSPDEELAIAAHLRTCPEPHVELRDAAPARELLEASIEPEPAPRRLRDRIMASIDAPAVVPIEAATADAERPAAEPVEHPRRRWVLPALAGLAAAASVALLVWNVQLRSELDQRTADLQQLATAIAAGEATIAVSGSAGTGYLIDAEQPVLVASVAATPAGSLYEMWLIDAAGTPVAVGTFEMTENGVQVVPLEQSLAGFETFAITVESERVEAPTGDPVLVAPLSG
jgi:anti-sigma-K factor RskA